MATVAETKLLTAEEFMAADLGDGNFELVRGEIVEMPPANAGAWACLRQRADMLWDHLAANRDSATRSPTTRPW